MTDLDKLSHNGKKSRLRWMWWGLGILACLTVGVFLLWQNRASLLAGQIEKRLAKMGYEADLSIETLTTHSARITDIRIAQDGEVFFLADSLKLEFAGRAVFAGVFEKATLVRPKLTVHIDETGQIVDRWLPSQSGAQQKPKLPSKGVFIEDAIVQWEAPFASAETEISGEIITADHWSAVVHSPGILWQSEFGVIPVDFDTTIESQGINSFRATGTIRIVDLSSKTLQMSGLQTNYSVHIKRGEGNIIQAKGWTQFAWQHLVSPDFESGPADSRLEYTAFYDAPNKKLVDMQADWDVNIQDAGLVNTQKRTRLANLLTAYDAALVAPVAQHFIGDIRNQAAQMFAHFGLTGQGSLAFDQSGYKIALLGPLHVSGDGQNLQISPKRNTEFVVFDQAAGKLFLRADLDWTARRALHIRGLDFRAHSRN
ncbi:MAG TPA: hypothetical protein ENJ42_01755, partial [Hellea balneolensis]|nr:hypothetical protein [Hellea balneolensis]